MVKPTQTIRRRIADELFECVYHFVGLALKGLKVVIFSLMRDLSFLIHLLARGKTGNFYGRR